MERPLSQAGLQYRILRRSSRGKQAVKGAAVSLSSCSVLMRSREGPSRRSMTGILGLTRISPIFAHPATGEGRSMRA